MSDVNRWQSAGQSELLDLLIEGSDLQYADKPAQALKLYEQALAQAPTDAYIMNQTAVCKARLGRFDEARRDFAKVVDLHGENVFARLWLGVLELEAGRGEEARRQFEAVLRQSPGNGGALYCLGVMALVERQSAAAVELFERARRSGGNDARLLVRLARAFRGLDMPANAELALRQALTLDPKELQALHLLGWLEHNRGEIDQALATWERALSINPSNREARRNIAKVLHEQALAEDKAGRREEAERLWRRVLRIFPGHRAADHYLQAGSRSATM